MLISLILTPSKLGKMLPKNFDFVSLFLYSYWIEFHWIFKVLVVFCLDLLHLPLHHLYEHHNQRYFQCSLLLEPHFFVYLTQSWAQHTTPTLCIVDLQWTCWESDYIWLQTTTTQTIGDKTLQILNFTISWMLQSLCI